MALSVTCRPEATGLTTGERSDAETVTLRSERGGWKRAITRWYLASRLLNLEYPFLNKEQGAGRERYMRQNTWPIGLSYWASCRAVDVRRFCNDYRKSSLVSWLLRTCAGYMRYPPSKIDSLPLQFPLL